MHFALYLARNSDRRLRSSRATALELRVRPLHGYYMQVYKDSLLLRLFVTKGFQVFLHKKLIKVKTHIELHSEANQAPSSGNTPTNLRACMVMVIIKLRVSC